MIDVEALFPGLGYFGPHDHDGLRVRIPVGADGLLIMLDGPGDQILNLDGVTFLSSEGAPMALTEEGIIVEISSCYEDDPRHGADSVRQGFACHTKLERNPWLRFSWSGGAPAEVIVRNRPDRFASRSRSISLHVHESGAWREIHRQTGGQRLLKLLRVASQHMPGRDLLRFSRSEYDDARRHLASSISLCFARGDMSEDDCELALAMTRMFGGADSTDEALLATCYAYWLSKGHSIPHLSPSWGVLDTVAKIESAESCINELLSKRGIATGVMLSRHGLVRSKLVSMAAEYVDVAAKVVDAAQCSGVELMLCYGTLLGAVRDRGFIGHDDDMDLLFVTNDPPGSTDSRDRLILALKDLGFHVATKEPLLNFEVSLEQVGPSVDVFPAWLHGDMIRLYMERMGMRDVPARLLLPTSSLPFYGREFRCPAEPAEFLTARYGAEWGVGDRFFEWPYPLSGSRGSGLGGAENQAASAS